MARRILRASEQGAVFRPDTVNPIPDDPQRPRTENDAPHPDADPYLPFDPTEIPQGSYKPIKLYRGLYINRNDPDPLLRPIEDILSAGRDQGTTPTLDGGYNPDIPRNYTSQELGPAILNYLKRRGGMFQHNRNLPEQDHGFGSHWSTNRDFAQHMALAGMDDPDYDGNQATSGILPVMIEADWNHQGEDPNRTGVGYISPETADREREITLLPNSPLNITNVHIRHPQGSWHPVLPTPMQHYAHRLAAVNQASGFDPTAVTHRLKGEFDDWWESGPKKMIKPPRPTPGLPALTDPYGGRGPIGHWPNVEAFLEDRYPQAGLGYNEALGKVDLALDVGRYQTGPEAVAQYGYDPAEIAAGMLLLHSGTDPRRGPGGMLGDRTESDRQRLVDIFTKRQQMQQAFDQKQKLVTAQSLLVGPDLAYDEWDWDRRHKEHPPVEDTTDGEWFHVSPHKLDEGTVLAPMRGKTPWEGDPYDHGLQNRANWVWVEHDESKARAWMHWVLDHQPQANLYRVKPHLPPAAWNGTADEGWVTDRATVLEELRGDKTAAAHDYSLASMWRDYQDWWGDNPEPAQSSVQKWTNIQKYLGDRHGLTPAEAAYGRHPAAVGIAKVHSLAQGKDFVDGVMPTGMDDDDLLQGAALGLLKIHQKESRRKMASPTARYILLPHWDAEECVDILHDHHADMQTRTAAPLMNQQWGNDVMDAAKGGGFTLHDHVGDGPTNGYMVSLDKQTEFKRPITELNADDVRDFVGKNSVALTKPNNYLGGWLDGGQFYLDISSHMPHINQATSAAVLNHQLGIYDLGHGRTINTDEAGWMTGNPGIVGSRNHGRASHSPQERPRRGGQHLASGRGSAAAEGRGRGHRVALHDWTQHTLGYPELLRTAATFDPKVVQPMSGAGGSHGAQIYRDPTQNVDWVVKQPPKGQEYLASLDVAANTIAKMSGIDTPETYLTDLGHGPASAQVKFPKSTDAFPGKKFDPEKLSDDDILTIQKHHALDWLLSNHDSHPMGFIRLQDGRLAGIDKGQSYKMFGQDKLGWNFHPNQDYGETEPVYNTLYRNFATGGRKILDPRQGELAKYIQGLQDMPDDQFTGALKPYAEAAAKCGALCHPWKHTGLVPSTIPPNDVNAFLAAAVARKKALLGDFGTLYDRALAHRVTGTKIARLEDVRPRLSSFNETDGLARDSELLGEYFLCLSALSDINDVGLGEVGPRTLFSDRQKTSIPGLPEIVSGGSQVKVGGLTTDFSVTPVQDVLSLGDGAAINLVGRDMRSDRFPFSINGNTELSIAMDARSGPVPASITGRIVRHEPSKGLPLREMEGTQFAGTISHIDTPNVGRAPGLFPQVRERSLRQGYSPEQEPLPFDVQGEAPLPLYRGMVLELNNPEMGMIRRSLLGNSFEDNHSPDQGRYAPCNGCPHPGTPPQGHPGPGDGVQGALPLTKDFSDAALATNGKGRWKQMGSDILDLVGPGDDADWTTDATTAQKMALAGKRNALRLPVMLSKASPLSDIDVVSLLHPQSGHWHDVMPSGKTARLAYAPEQSSMQQVIDHNQDLGTHGSQLWKDPQGNWLLKKPGKNQEFMIPLDVATSQLQQLAGLEGPEVHAVPMRSPYGTNYMVSAHKMYPDAQQAWKKPPGLHEVDPEDLLTLQKHQALDWLIANHDPHVGNFLRTPNGLVGVDKGQALKYFGRDRLDWNFHPNYYAREPIYNNLWRDYASGRPGEMNDPREGPLGDFVQNLQNIPDDKLRELFHPYADAAARVGLLATGDKDPNRGQTLPRVKPNDPNAFLDALVKRKSHLAEDLGELYDRAATHRAVAAINAEGGEPELPTFDPSLPSGFRKIKPQKSTGPQWDGEVPQYGPPKHELNTRPQVV